MTEPNYTDDELRFLEECARAMFEADPSSNMEADWPNLAPYKRRDWLWMAEIRHGFLDTESPT